MPSPAKRVNPRDPTGMKALEARNMKRAAVEVDKIIARVLKTARERNITDPAEVQRIVAREAAAWGEAARRLAVSRIAQAQAAGLAHSETLLKIIKVDPGPAELVAKSVMRSTASATQARVLNDYDVLVAELKQRLTDAVIEVSQVDSPSKAVEAVQERTAGVRNHVRQVASAETLNPFRTATTSHYQLVGIEMVEWFTALDERVCDYCRAKHGKKYPLDRVPDTHNGCRCDLMPYTDAEWYRLERVPLGGLA